MEDKDNKNPMRVQQCGPVKVAIWLDSRIVNGAVVEMHSIKFNRAYMDGDEWKHTYSFTVEDLPKIAVLATEIYKFLRVRTFENGSQDESQ